MDRVFRVDFYPHEWLTLTSHMTPEQKGIFIDICAMIYAKRGAIKNDAAHIARVSNCSPRLVRSVVLKLLEQGDLMAVGDDFITQKRCESELNKKRSHLELSAKGGRNRAEKESETRKNKDISSRVLKPTLSSSSPSLSLREEESKDSPSHSTLDLPDLDFEEFWTGWKPVEMSKGDKKDAAKAYRKARKEIPHETLIRTRDQYLENCRNLRCKTKHASSWLNGRGWEHDDALGAIEATGHGGRQGGGAAYKQTALELAMADKTRR